MIAELNCLHAPRLAELILAGGACGCFLTATVQAYRRFATAGRGAVWTIVVPLLLAILLDAVLIAWRVNLHGAKHVPLADNFDTILFFVSLLAVVTAYLNLVGRLGAIDLFVLPLLTLCQLAAILLAGMRFKAFGGQLLVTFHIGSFLISGSCFALAAAAGSLYLWESRQLRRLKAHPPAPPVPALESLEKVIGTAVSVGFAFLTVSYITGILEAQRLEGGLAGYLNAKVLIGTAVWLAYAALLHRRYWPKLSGTRAAWLAIGGFACLVVLYAGLAIR